MLLLKLIILLLIVPIISTIWVLKKILDHAHSCDICTPIDTE